MANTSVCNDTSEAIELYEPQGLFLKPVAKINICAQLPQLKTPGKTITSWEVIEKVKHMIRPEVFLSVKVVKSTMEFIRLEGEIENKSKLSLLVMKLDNKTIKLSGFTETLKVRAAEAKVTFPVRHDWDSYFRDARNMNELKPGERPDTIHLKDLPTRWFMFKSDKDKASKFEEEKLKPSEDVLRQVFGTFGEVRSVDIPTNDPYRKEIMGVMTKPGTIQTFTYGQDLTFEAYVQFKEYISFVKAMDSLRGMKLLFKEEDGKALTANIKVDFDKAKHLSDKMIRKRRLEREKLEELEKLRLEQAQQEKEEELRRAEAERQHKLELERERQRKKEERQQKKEQRRKEREERRRQKLLEQQQREEEERMQLKIALEERRLLIAQRKLESLRVLSELFERVKDAKVEEEVAQRKKEIEEEQRQKALVEQRRRLEEERQKAEAKIQKKLQMRQHEVELREKILKNVQAKEQQEQDKKREELRQKLSGTRRLKSAVIMKQRLASIVQGKDKESLQSEKRKIEDNDKLRATASDEDEDVVSKTHDKSKLVFTGSVESNETDKRNKPSALERVLKNNKLRAWGGASDDESDTRKRKGPVPENAPKKKKKMEKILIIKKIEKVRDDDSDSADSTITIIPPPRSSFAPPDDPAAQRPFVGPVPPGVPFPPSWGLFPPPPIMIPPMWECHPLSPAAMRGRDREYQPSAQSHWSSRLRSLGPSPGRNRRNFHIFKQPYLKKYNFKRGGLRESTGRSRDSSTSSKLSQKLSTKKDHDGRFMYPLP